jgi:iron complex transport system ATP-binding protein
MLEVRHLSVHFGAFQAVDDVSFSVKPGEWLMIVGPNGAGKSTVLNAVGQAVPYAGEVLLAGRDARHMKAKERAQKMGSLAQSHTMGYAFTVEEIVRLGRYAYTGAFSGFRETDEQAVRDALRFTGMEPLRAHSVLTLSGGELQRAFLSQLFAQNPPLLLLDEPTNHLDLAYQKQAFELIRHWLTQPGRAAVSVVHDLSLALSYGSHALLMLQGRAIAAGTVAETLSRENLYKAYGMDVHGWMRELFSQWPQETAPCDTP